MNAMRRFLILIFNERPSRELEAAPMHRVTILDVLDELELILICVGYELVFKAIPGLPILIDQFADCKPVYEDVPGWQESTVGVTDYERLPANARAYLERIEEIVKIPVDIVSTGPDREQTIIKRHPFD